VRPLQTHLLLHLTQLLVLRVQGLAYSRLELSVFSVVTCVEGGNH
jgi:hypothetical protein